MENEKETIPGSLLTLTAGIAVTLISFWYGQHNGLLPEQVSEQAPLVDKFFNVMVTIGTALFLIVEGTILLALIKFRKRKGDESDAEPIKGNLPLEAFWTAIPAILVIGLGIYSVQVYENMGGFEPAGHHMMAGRQSSSAVGQMSGAAIAAPLMAQMPEMTSEEASTQTEMKYGFGAAPEREGNRPDLAVNVKGLQYAWIFNYPESGITSGELHVPVNKDVLLNISALDVIHSFWVPQFRLKQDAIPGNDTQLRFVATKTGTYPVVCAELCGSYHGSMRTTLTVHTPEEYEAWVEENRIAQQPELDRTVAVKSNDLSTPEFLAPYAEEMGIDTNTLAQIHATHR